MPQPKKPTGQGESTAEDDPRSALAAIRDLLLLPSERVRDTLDDAVRRGRITRTDAEELVDRLMELGRQQTDDVLGRLEKLVPGLPRRGTGADGEPELPIERYDDLTAAQITARLEQLEVLDLRVIEDYEKRNANRKSVLNAVEKRLRAA